MSNRQERHAAKFGIFGKYAYAWITLAFFAVSIVLHWYFGWRAFVNQAAEHHTTPELSQFMVEAARDTFENWQSEFLQLLWQVVGLAYSSISGRRPRKRTTTGSRPRSTR